MVMWFEGRARGESLFGSPRTGPYSKDLGMYHLFGSDPRKLQGGGVEKWKKGDKKANNKSIIKEVTTMDKHSLIPLVRSGSQWKTQTSVILSKE